MFGGWSVRGGFRLGRDALAPCLELAYVSIGLAGLSEGDRHTLGHCYVEMGFLPKVCVQDDKIWIKMS